MPHFDPEKLKQARKLTTKSMQIRLKRSQRDIALGLPKFVPIKETLEGI